MHERSAELDLLLLALRRRLTDTRRDRGGASPPGTRPRLVLMSATIDTAPFERYFSAVSGGVSVVDVPGRAHPVRRLTLEDVRISRQTYVRPT